MSGPRRTLLVTLVGVLLLSLLVWRVTGSEPPEAAAARPEAAAAVEPEQPDTGLVEGLTGGPTRSRVEPATARAVAPDPAADAVDGWSGWAGEFGYDIAGAALGAPEAALPDIAVGLRGGVVLARTDAQGRFTLPASKGPRPGATVEIVEPGFLALSSAKLPASGSPGRDLPLLLAARLTDVSVEVVDPQGQPLSGASVTVRLASEALVGRASRLEGLRTWSARARTAGNGVATLRDCPSIGPLVVTGRLAGHSVQSYDTGFLSPEEPFTIVLPALEFTAETRILRGQVLTSDGGPPGGAELRIGRFGTAASEDGSFALPVPSKYLINQSWDSGGGRLVVMLEGYAPGVFSMNRLELDEYLTVLLEPAATIEGHLVRAGSGEPLVGWRMKLADGRVYAQDSQQPFLAEDLADGHLLPRSTGRDGGFRFGGLDAGRTYRLRAWNPETFEIVTSEPIRPAPAPHRFEVPSDWVWPLVSGIVSGPNGQPIEGCRVRLTMAEHRVEGGVWMQTRDTVHSDARGYFELVDVPRNELFLRFNAPGLPSSQVELAPDSQVLGLSVVLGGE